MRKGAKIRQNSKENGVLPGVVQVPSRLVPWRIEGQIDPRVSAGCRSAVRSLRRSPEVLGNAQGGVTEVPTVRAFRDNRTADAAVPGDKAVQGDVPGLLLLVRPRRIEPVKVL